MSPDKDEEEGSRRNIDWSKTSPEARLEYSRSKIRVSIDEDNIRVGKDIEINSCGIFVGDVGKLKKKSQSGVNVGKSGVSIVNDGCRKDDPVKPKKPKKPKKPPIKPPTGERPTPPPKKPKKLPSPGSPALPVLVPPDPPVIESPPLPTAITKPQWDSRVGYFITISDMKWYSEVPQIQESPNVDLSFLTEPDQYLSLSPGESWQSDWYSTGVIRGLDISVVGKHKLNYSRNGDFEQ